MGINHLGRIGDCIGHVGHGAGWIAERLTQFPVYPKRFPTVSQSSGVQRFCEVGFKGAHEVHCCTYVALYLVRDIVAYRPRTGTGKVSSIARASSMFCKIVQALRVSGDLSTEPVCNLILGMGHPFSNSTQGVLQRFRPLSVARDWLEAIPSRCAATLATAQLAWLTCRQPCVAGHAAAWRCAAYAHALFRAGRYVHHAADLVGR